MEFSFKSSLDIPNTLCFLDGKMSFCRTKSDLALRGLCQNSQLVFLMGEFKKLNGRPQLTEGKRCKKIDTRFTEDEYNEIIALETELGISKTELVRMRVLNNTANIVINSKELIKHLDSLGAEMGRAGNNINQLAKHANTLKLQGAVPPSVAIQFNKLLEEYIKMQQVLEIALRKVIRTMGK